MILRAILFTVPFLTLSAAASAQGGVPGTPELLAPDVSGTTVTLRWTPDPAGAVATSWLLEVVVGRQSQQYELPGSLTSITATGVTAGTYRVRIRGRSGAGLGAASNEQTIVVTSGGCTPPPRPVVTVALAGTLVTITWTGSNAETTFTVDVSGAFNGAFTVSGLALSGNAGPGTYSVRVKATKLCGESEWSEPRSFTVGGAPPAPSPAALRALWVETPRDVHVVGDGGTILHYDGSTWTPEHTGTTNNLHGIGKGSTRFAVGTNGTILSYSGGRWTQMPSGTTATLYSASDPIPRGSTSTFAVGAGGTILYFDGTAWRQQASPTTEDLYGVGGSSLTDVQAIGANGTILQYDGATWRVRASGTSAALRGGTGTDRFGLAVGDGGTILLTLDRGQTFTRVQSGTAHNLRSADADSVEAFVVGNGGIVLRSNDGVTWRSESVGAAVDLNTVDGEQGERFAAGAGGAIFHYNGRVWTRQR